jgi:hypothetical protein
MTIDLKIQLQDGIVTITAGGATVNADKEAGPPQNVGPDPGGRNPVPGLLVIGPLLFTSLGANSNPGDPPSNVGPDPGAVWAAGVLAVGPIVICGGSWGTLKNPFNPANNAPGPQNK